MTLIHFFRRSHIILSLINIYIEGSPTHSHPPNADKVNVKEAIDKLKNEAKTSCEPTRNVVSKIVSDVSKITISKLPPIDMLSQTVRRTRNKYNDYPKNPINITDLILPDQKRGFHFCYTILTKKENVV